MPRAKKQDHLEQENVPSDVRKVQQPYACPDDAKWGGFLNYTPTEDEKDDFFEWTRLPSADDHYGFLWEALEAGIKMSLMYDAKHDAWVCTFTGSLLRDGQRQAISSRAGDASTAIMLAVYKHKVILQGDYVRLKSGASGWMRFG